MAVLAVLLTAGVSLAAGRSHDSAPLVYAAEVDGIIQPVTAEFMTSAIDRADADGAALLVFTLRTPGGLVESTQTIVSRMVAARTPIVVFVGPAGARAASAGFILVLAADVAVMAPGTHMGAAHPVTLGGDSSPKMDDTMSQKLASDLAAWTRSLAERRKRNVALAAEAVTASRAFTDTEAIQGTPPLIDFVASDLRDVVAKLDGRSIARFDGHTATIRTAGARIVDIEMTRRQQLLSAIAHPQVAQLLLMIGVLGITVELWTPGAVVPGVVGGVCLLLAFFALQVLPVSATGLLLILFGLGLLIVEIKVQSFGVLGLAGVLSLMVGSLMLPGEVPGVAPHSELVVAAALAISAILVFLGRLALRAQRQPASSGLTAMIGQQGRALAPIGLDRGGQVAVRGEIWNAAAVAPVAEGELVTVVAVDGLTLRVAPASGLAEGVSR
jgi:membrane-bound serine protease (ClpP class)